jgi:serine/threonine protein kinase
MQSMLEKQIGNYRITAEIASGTFGSVYLAKHLVFDDEPPVAIKLLHTHLGSQKERERFLQEARFLRKLKHPYILPLLDAGLSEGFLYLVVEYASNGTLCDRLCQRPSQPLPLGEALLILSQIAQALQYAHSQNIVHRDLKPANILFNPKGEAILADFSIAVVLEQTKRVGEGGTPLYMAPEQFRGEVSKKSDQYALGCIAYELLTGQRPFVALDFLSMAYKHVHEQPPSPTQLNPNLPGYMERAILKAMAKQREDRYGDISAFIAALQRPPEPTVILGRSQEDWLKEGNTFLNQKCYEEALKAYEEAIRLDPNYAIAHTSKGYVLYRMRSYEEALKAYEEAIRLDPNYAIAHTSKGRTLTELKRYEEALKAYEEAIRLDPNYVIAHTSKGYALTELKHYGEALRAYEEAIRLDPNYAIAHANKGNTLNELNRYGEALRAYEEAIRLDPNYAIAYANKGNVLIVLKYYSEALIAYEEAIRLDPNDAADHASKGYVLTKLKRYDEALIAYEEAIRLDPTNVITHTSKGYVLTVLKRYGEALRAYEEAIRLDPNNTDARNGKDAVLKKLKKSARKWWY